MKIEPSLLIPVALIAVCVLAQADTAGSEMLTQRMEEFRECFVKNLNCAALREGFKQNAISSNIPSINADQQADSDMEQARSWFAGCPEAKIPLSTIKTKTQIIVHNFLLDECMDRIASPETLSNLDMPPLEEAAVQLTFAGEFRQTEYQLGHITREQYDNYSNQYDHSIKALFAAEQLQRTQAAQIQQLQQQLADIQSKDHQICRQIQAMAAVNGGVPPNC